MGNNNEPLQGLKVLPKKVKKTVNQSNFNKISLSEVEKNVMTYHFHFLPNSIDFCDWYSFYTKYLHVQYCVIVVNYGKNRPIDLSRIFTVRWENCR